ncbi:hypothetical protein CVT26_014578 [Gymnopilus dilepis]|uniref:UBC core domain-containing protein n=1 Tax=Gymnopilus dilepis TaxID=231916 RepID=A0A409W357_9AGAR|nr:hypothetical protein CVT26_014578 [Gymnopilus dilepis]
MPLFNKNPIRSAATDVSAAIVVSVAHFATKYLTSLHAFHLTQTSIAILAISALLFMIMMHHRMDGQVMSQTQEEMAVIGIFALFWVVAVIGYRSYTSKQGGGGGVTDLAVPKASPQDWWQSDPCAKDGVYCVYEEYTLMSDYEVSLVNDNMQEFYVRFYGPAETPFAGGVWKIHVELPDQYPFKSPSIGFMNKIFHPNIDELSGSVCLDVINQTWSPMFDMINIFEVFLPQLLRYPNPNDPLNGEAAALLMRHPKEYEAKVKEYVQRFATKEAADAATDKNEEDDQDEEMSDIGSISDDGE